MVGWCDGAVVRRMRHVAFLPHRAIGVRAMYVSYLKCPSDLELDEQRRRNVEEDDDVGWDDDRVATDRQLPPP